jgi:hypothetical protein
LSNRPTEGWDILGLLAEWHHLLPKKYRAIFERRGLAINSAKYGWILEAEDHRLGKVKIEPDWEREWDDFFRKNPNPTDKQILNHLGKITKKYKHIFAKGAVALHSYHQWKNLARENREKFVKEAAEKLAKRGARKAGKRVVKKVPFVSLLFLADSIKSKGVANGVADCLVDAIPYMGWAKAGAECVGGDFFPDSDDPAIINQRISEWEDFGKPHEPINCFVAGTQISMADGSQKNIEDIVIGDSVLSWSERDQKIVSGQVVETHAPLHNNLVDITIGEVSVTCTPDHPIYVKGKGWCSVRPDLTRGRYPGFSDIPISKLYVSDTCFVISSGALTEMQVGSIVVKNEKNVETYNFRVKNTHTYFANKLLVHNK